MNANKTNPLETERLRVDEIPALFWGPASAKKMIVAAHGNLSSKSDVPFEILAQEAVPRGFRILTFDLPKHGERKGTAARLEPRTCVAEFRKIVEFASRRAESVSFAGVSLGAYFGLLAFDGERGAALKQALFLSPILNMERLIQSMRRYYNISDERLETEKEIALPNGQTLSWDYSQFVRKNPIQNWRVPTAILRGANDELCERTIDEEFATKFSVRLETAEQAAHYFHTEDELRIYRAWIRQNLND